MTEYWVSQAKFYCKYCNVWIADNKPSRQHHDTGVKHKEKVSLFNKKKREDKLFGAKSEHDLKQQLASIEKAALQAVAQDREELPGMFGISSSVSTAYHHRNSNQSNLGILSNLSERQSTFSLKNIDQTNTLESIAKNLREDETGRYTIKGQTYLEGRFHEEKLKTNVECEIFIESLDEWIPAIILSSKEIVVPHTEIKLKSFRVKYKPSKESNVSGNYCISHCTF
jgi:hypothetical protein